MSKKILIVEDEPVLLNALVEKFTRASFEVITAKNGKEGLQTSLVHHPDIILLDVVMPVMDGLTFIGELRKDVWGKKAKIILLTNLSDPAKITTSIIKNVSGYMVKSDWKIADVVEQVTKKLAE